MEIINSLETFLQYSPGQLFIFKFKDFDKRKEINTEFHNGYKWIKYLTPDLPFLVLSTTLFQPKGKDPCVETKIIQNNILGYIVVTEYDFESMTIKKWKL